MTYEIKSYLLLIILAAFFLQPSLCAQTHLQLGIGVRKLNVSERTSNNLEGFDVHGKPFTQATKLLVSLGARREVSENLSFGMQFTYQQYEMSGDPQDGFINTIALGFNHYRVHLPISWEPLSNWVFTLGPEISVLRDHYFVYVLTENWRGDQSRFNTFQYGLMGGVGYRYDCFLLKLDVAKGLFVGNRELYENYIKPVATIELSVIYEQPLGKGGKKRGRRG